MNSKKIVAIIVSALMLSTPVFATSVSQVGNIMDLVSVTDSTVSFPIFVIGSTAATADVAGAVGAAVKMAAQAKTTSVVSIAGVEETVTGGAKIETPGNRIVPWEIAQGVKGIFTSSDLSFLADKTYQPASGTSYTYKQYLYFAGETTQTTVANTPHIEYSKPTAENTPRLSLKVPISQDLYAYKLTFSTPASLGGTATNADSLLDAVLVGTSLSIMGKDFVISDSTYTATTCISDLSLLGGGVQVTVETGTDKTVTFAGKDYVIHVDSVASEAIGTSTYYSVIGNVNGESIQLRAGQSKTLSDGTFIGAIKVFAPIVAGQAGYASFTIGGAVYKVYASGTVTKGTQAITGLASTITATCAGGWSSLVLTYQPNEDNFVAMGDEITEPFAEAFSVKFNSFTPAVDDTTSRQTISFNPSGYNMLLKYKNAAGNEETIYLLYYDTSSTVWRFAQTSVTSFDNGWRDVVFDESQNISAGEGDYFIIQKSGFSHVLRFTTMDPSNNLFTFTDETGAVINVYNTSATYAPLIIDGNTFAVFLSDTLATKKVIQVDLNGDGDVAGTACSSSSCGGGTTAGSEYSFFVPKLITTGQGGLYLYGRSGSLWGNNTVTADADGEWANIGLIPLNVTGSGSSGAVYNSAGTSLLAIANDSTQYNITTTADSGYMDFVITCTGAWACNIGIGTATTGMKTSPGVVLVEEAQEGGTAHKWIYIPMAYDSTTTRTYVTTPVSSDTNYDATLSVTGAVGDYRGMTTYGSLVEYLAVTAGGSGTIKYPDTFGYGNVYLLGSDGTITTGGVAGEVTTDVVLPITADIVKLDSEITSTDKTTKDLVLVGGPCVNTLVADLATAGNFPYTCAGWPGRNFGRVQVISGGFATGYTVAVIAGTRAADTDLAARVVQTGFPGASSTQKAGSYLEITGTVTSPAYST